MRIEHQKIGSVDVLTPIGALIDDDAEEFGRQLLERVRSDNLRVVVGMQEVPYLDSIALEAFLDATDALANYADCLRLSNVSPTCREILEITGLSHRFRFFSDNHDAVKSFL